MSDLPEWTEEVIGIKQILFFVFLYACIGPISYDKARKQILQLYIIWICWYLLLQISISIDIFHLQ